MANEETATCPSCSLIIRVIYDPVSNSSTQTIIAIPITLPFPGDVRPRRRRSDPRELPEETGHRRS